jgi:hypothetical protein
MLLSTTHMGSFSAYSLWYHWLMSEHRVRLSDEDLTLIIAALRARRAMSLGLRQHRIDRLVSRLAEGRRGNPKFTLGEDEQTHEDELDPDEL